MPTSDTPNGALTAVQRRAALAMAAGRQAKSVAADLGVSESTIMRWRRLPAFQAALHEAESELLGDYSRQLTGLTQGATAAYAAALSKDAPLLTRLRAADSVSRNLVSIRELAQLEARLTELEAAVALAQAQQQELISASIEDGSARLVNKIDYRVALRESGHPDVSND